MPSIAPLKQYICASDERESKPDSPTTIRACSKLSEKKSNVTCHLYARPMLQTALEFFKWVKFDIIFTKWGNTDEKLLNGVIHVKKIELWGKNWNLLFF